MNYGDKKRAETLVGVLRYLLEVQAAFNGPSEASRLADWANQAKPYDYEPLGISGFGLSGFQYLRILLGAQAVKPDVHIRRFVSEAVGRPVQDVQALGLLKARASTWRGTFLSQRYIFEGLRGDPRRASSACSNVALWNELWAGAD